MTAPHRFTPTLAFGTYQLLAGEEVESAVTAAIAEGHRVFDTAAVYRNESSVGKALKASGLPRDQYHLTTKLQPSDQQGFDAALAGVSASLAKLGVDFVDCYLMHWPATARLAVDSPKNAALRLESWRGIVEARNKGLTREIGVCNFQVRHLEAIVAAGLPLPQVHQLELHPMCRQSEVVAWCRARGIAIEAYSPLAQFDKRIVSNPRILAAIAKATRDAAAEEDAGAEVPKTFSNELICEAFLAWSFWKQYTPLARSKQAAHIACNARIAQQFRDALKASAPSDDSTAPHTAVNQWPRPPADHRLTRLAVALDAVPVTQDLHVCWNSDVVS